jgi:hypothetical protein
MSAWLGSLVLNFVLLRVSLVSTELQTIWRSLPQSLLIFGCLIWTWMASFTLLIEKSYLVYICWCWFLVVYIYCGWRLHVLRLRTTFPKSGKYVAVVKNTVVQVVVLSQHTALLTCPTVAPTCHTRTGIKSMPVLLLNRLDLGQGSLLWGQSTWTALWTTKGFENLPQILPFLTKKMGLDIFEQINGGLEW